MNPTTNTAANPGRFRGLAVLGAIAVWTAAAPAFGAVTISSLTATAPSPQPLGTPVKWVAVASDPDGGILEFRFSVRASGSPDFTIIRDFYPLASVDWTTIEGEGVVDVKVEVRNVTVDPNVSSELTESFSFTPRAIAGPVVNETTNPLVALYSAPPCPAGAQMRVKFQRIGSNVPDFTPLKDCDGATTMNFYIAGMRQRRPYLMQHQTFVGLAPTNGPVLNFTTGSIPAVLSAILPTYSVGIPPTPNSSLLQKFHLHDDSGTIPVATDLFGRIVWYYDATLDARAPGGFNRPIDGGTFLASVDDELVEDEFLRWNRLLREVDLVGNTLRETNVARVSEQVIAMGSPEGITSFHHDALRLPNGNTLSLCSNERLFPAGTQGAEEEVLLIGDCVVELDENFQVVWFWSGFDHLDTEREAVLGELCDIGQAGCPPFTLAEQGRDWLHSNGLNYIPADGDFLISSRHQDWVIKVDFADGGGSGAVEWRLGRDGDFTIDSDDPFPWFSHQHDGGFEIGGTRFLSIFDNGNTRVAELGSGNSRGQVYDLDLVNMTTSLFLNADLGTYSAAVGNAQRLSNGNFSFDSGFVNFNSAEVTEVTPAGEIIYSQTSTSTLYRSYRITNMYTPLNK